MSLLRFVLPWLLLAGTSLAAYFTHGTARRRDPDHDAGSFWALMLKWSSPMAAILAITAAIESQPGLWQTGWHLEFDRVSSWRWAFVTALLIPFVLWGVLTLFALDAAGAHRANARWISGSIEPGGSRNWILLFTVPLILPLLWLGPARLGGGPDSYPAVVWGTLATTVISLIGLALSSADRKTLFETRPDDVDLREALLQLPPWPVKMREMGIAVDALTEWPAGTGARAISKEAAEFQEHLEQLGAGRTAPQIVEALARLMSPAGSSSGRAQKRSVLLFTPDHCGQLEAIVAAAAEIAEADQTCTLIITPQPDAELADRIEKFAIRCSGGESDLPVLPIRSDSKLPPLSAIWIVDAATLSDDLMVRLADPAVASRIGFVVWWDVHRYSGVMAANMWAVSRRLHRLLRSKGAADLRTLAVVRESPFAAAHLLDFVRRLLPDFPAGSEVHVDRHSRQPVHLYLLRGHQDYFRKNPRSPIAETFRHPTLVAGLVSANIRWPTCLSTSGRIPDDEIRRALDQWAGDGPLREALAESPSVACARIVEIDEGETLSIAELVSQGGRDTPGGIPHHAAIVLPWNPYVEYVLLRNTGTENLMETSRRLVGAEGHPSIYRRHLLLALSEQEDTLEGIKHMQLWEEGPVSETLTEIGDQGKLSRREVRYINRDLRRVQDFVYSSMMQLADEKRPLDTVEESLTTVRAVTEDDRVVMRVDANRKSIQAYPGRVFLSNGKRYKIRDWDEARGWIACVTEESHSLTWRRRIPTLSNIRWPGAEHTVPGPRRQLTQYAVNLKYSEFVSGHYRRDFNLTAGTLIDTPRYTEPATAEFETMALMIEIRPQPAIPALGAVCQALRHVLPVHLGVDSDAVELIPVEGLGIEGRLVWGIAIVDLYPQGIGLVEAIKEDTHWTLDTLGWTRDWLEDTAPIFNSPLAKATSGGGESPELAIALINELLPPKPRQSKTIKKRIS